MFSKSELEGPQGWSNPGALEVLQENIYKAGPPQSCRFKGSEVGPDHLQVVLILLV